MGVTVKVCDPVIPDMLAEIVVVPLVKPITTPALIEATFAELEDHVARVVKSLLDPSLYDPVAVNCALPLTGIDCPVEVTLIDLRVVVCETFVLVEWLPLLPQSTVVPIKSRTASAKVAFQIGLDNFPFIYPPQNSQSTTHPAKDRTVTTRVLGPDLVM